MPAAYYTLHRCLHNSAGISAAIADKVKPFLRRFAVFIDHNFFGVLFNFAAVNQNVIRIHRRRDFSQRFFQKFFDSRHKVVRKNRADTARYCLFKRGTNRAFLNTFFRRAPAFQKIAQCLDNNQSPS